MTLLWKTKSNKSISIIEDGISELLYHYYEVHCEKDSYCRRQLVQWTLRKQYYYRDIFSRWMDLAYNTYQQCGQCMDYRYWGCFIYDLMTGCTSCCLSQHLIQQTLFSYVFFMFYNSFALYIIDIFLIVTRYIQLQILYCILTLYQLIIFFIST